MKWSAAGLSAGQACEANGTSGPVAARRVDRTWDGRNRLTALAFPDGKGNQAWTYTPDGLPASIATNNTSGGNTVTNSYSYNRRRLPTQETLVADASNTWSLGTGYNANGHLTSEVYPAGLTVTYTVNALGQPTQISAQDVSTVNVASAVSYFPNGAVKQFTYGNGMVHTATQNTRSLPLRTTDCTTSGTCASANRRLDLEYGYDGNGNVGAITDHVSGAKQTRAMTYDARDRLTQTTSSMFGTASYGYDALDNLTTVNVTGGSHIRNHVYCYSNNQLATVRTGSCSGSIVQSLSYDVQGNLASKGGQTFTFDYGNRLREISGVAYYLYDGHGLRVRSSTTGSAPYLYGMYDRGGKLRWQRDEQAGQRLRHIYLGNRLLAEHRKPIGSNTETIEYLHVDALGSPIARTNASKTTIQSSEHEPYGLMVNRANDNRPGFTGHVMDAGTGLTYMQQRYYDPGIGRFLSVDPVTAYDNGDMRFFNRYKYASNNPYSFTDPDGRADYYNFPNGVVVVVQSYDNKSQFSNAQIEGQASKFNGPTSSGKNMIVLFRPGTGSDAVKITTNQALSDAPGSNNRSHADKINGRNVELAPNAVGAITAGHEMGHTIGAGDQYSGGIDANGQRLSSDVPGTQGAIMRDYGGNPATQQTRDEIEKNATQPGNRVLNCSSMQGSSCK